MLNLFCCFCVNKMLNRNNFFISVDNKMIIKKKINSISFSSPYLLHPEFRPQQQRQVLMMSLVLQKK